ncbi:MAG: ABC transporter ATP-binding protein [Stappia sp.]|uniref:ABC transporter ATP-binding protein n=1 Tax=Stappia sp. TaxID=1870903 RepID=UPI000C3D0AB1|nr:ABC transporter ATP-binding protein [Stappia sp.]MAA97914.1 ABC transporter ATP-binding protein [Stappia sp.]MBM19672.1 ABC transporter ATP-binding protein [Stappia sp.]|tara:strand:- start:227 stop:1333 length:1107 start_codon:yes stop_codon:yes gene_type:complete
MHGQDVVLDGVSMRFGDFVAVQPTDLTINAGEFFSILGPSGCGKTTILRMVSGFLDPSSGDIRIGDKSMGGIRPNARPTALIFQNLALFPLMSVWENVAFGLEARGMSKKKRRARAEELLAMVALEGQGEKRPTELSGGQRQRVAIARALAVEPSVLLLDEPLSALDLKLRQHMRAELKELQRKTGVTFIYITHDQGEALTMSDRVAVMNRGVIQQVATADEIYNNPQTAFVAGFVGEQNVFAGRVASVSGGRAEIETPIGRVLGMNRHELAVGDEAIAMVRPERMWIGTGRDPEPAGEVPHNRVAANLQRRDLEGPLINLHLESAGQPIQVNLHNTGDAGLGAAREQMLFFAADDTLVMRPATAGEA